LWGWLRPTPDAPVARYGLSFPPGQELIDQYNMPFALAPDGSWIVYDGPAENGQQLWVKQRNSYQATPLTGTAHPPGGSAPAISPDGEWIVFTAEGQLRKVPRGGGSAITIADSTHPQFRGVAWLDDGTIVYRDAANRLRRVPDNGGEAAVVWATDSGKDERPRLPTPLPGARGVLFTVCTDGGCSEQGGWVLDFKSGQARALVPDAVMTWYTPTGHLVYVRVDGGVFAAPFDLGSLEVTGPSVPILEGVRVVANFFPRFAISTSGMMLMVAGPAGGGAGIPSEAVWVTRDGAATPVDSAWHFSLAGNYAWALSPDGRRLAVTLRGPTDNDVWIKELDRGPISRLTTDKAEDVRPHWTADGQSVSFITNRGANSDAYLRRADGTLPAEVLVDIDEDIYEAIWSRDGIWLVLRTGGLDGKRDIWAQHLGTDSAPTRLLATDFDENAVTLSPDGRWLAYQSDESGEAEIYVRPFPDISSGKWTVSLGGGVNPLWAHSGRELFYLHGRGNARQMMAAQVRTSPKFEVTERRTLFPVPPNQYLLPNNYTMYDISPDDRRFLLMRRAGSGDETPQTALILVENWFEELKAKMAR
ncbi:MAG: hypothetical protein OEV95_07395, partial [Gemmatimonadota bacterium]|nr:hypothetical protein [Gemmatimonadota bacterium]